MLDTKLLYGRIYAHALIRHMNAYMLITEGDLWHSPLARSILFLLHSVPTNIKQTEPRYKRDTVPLERRFYRVTYLRITEKRGVR